MSVVLTLGAITSRSLLPIFGARSLVISGSWVMAGGLAWMARMSVHANYPVHVLGPTLLWATGASIVTMPGVTIATSGIEPELAGLASGLVNTARQIGGAIGLAALAAAYAHGADTRHRVVHGYSAALFTAAGVALIVAILALLTRSLTARPTREPLPELTPTRGDSYSTHTRPPGSGTRYGIPGYSRPTRPSRSRAHRGVCQNGSTCGHEILQVGACHQDRLFGSLRLDGGPRACGPAPNDRTKELAVN